MSAVSQAQSLVLQLNPEDTGIEQIDIKEVTSARVENEMFPQVDMIVLLKDANFV